MPPRFVSHMDDADFKLWIVALQQIVLKITAHLSEEAISEVYKYIGINIFWGQNAVFNPD